MKKATKRLIYSSLCLLTTTSILILTSRMAQADLANKSSVINGLIEPSASKQFFEEGREQFDRVTNSLNNAKLSFQEDILQIDLDLLRKMKTQRSGAPRSGSLRDRNRYEPRSRMELDRGNIIF